MAEKEKRDWIPAVAVGVGGAGIALGLWLYLRKPPGIVPGDEFTAVFHFDYVGAGGPYYLQVRLGRHHTIPTNWFTAEAGLIWTLDVNLPVAGTYEFEIICRIPDAARPNEYDAEASIHAIGSDSSDYIIRVFKDRVIKVLEVS